MDKNQQHIDLDIQGMTCDGCARHVTEALQAVEGVRQAEVHGWRSGRATVAAANPEVSDETLVQAVREAGYRGKVVDRRSSGPALFSDRSGDADYDLIVIGTGGAGMAAAIKAAELGRRAGIIEAGAIGGTCVNIGCVPSKTLIRAAAAYHTAGRHPFEGLHTAANSLDWPAVVAQKDRLVTDLRQGKYVDVLKSYGDRITLIRGRARIQPDGSVAVDEDRVVRGQKIVIAAGARPRMLPLEGIDGVPALDSTSAMALTKQPRSLLVIGGRAVALELGQTFARFGTEVTILQRSDRIIPDHEPELSEGLTEALRDEGLTIHTGVTPVAIRQEGEVRVVTARLQGRLQEFRAEQALMAAGRAPNTQDMGLEDAGVQMDDQGFIVVDDRLQTTNPAIYAAGDVTNRPNLVYVAAAAGGIAAENALNGDGRRLDLTVLPDVIFTDPQVATVGLTEEEAKAQGYDVKTSTLPLAYVPRALAARETRGLVKLVADRATDRLLGAHILAAEAGEVVQTATLAIEAGRRYDFTVGDLRGMLFPYLTQVEGLKLAAQTFEKDVAQLSCCAG